MSWTGRYKNHRRACRVGLRQKRGKLSWRLNKRRKCGKTEKLHGASWLPSVNRSPRNCYRGSFTKNAWYILCRESVSRHIGNLAPPLSLYSHRPCAPLRLFARAHTHTHLHARTWEQSSKKSARVSKDSGTKLFFLSSAQHSLSLFFSLYPSLLLTQREKEKFSFVGCLRVMWDQYTWLRAGPPPKTPLADFIGATFSRSGGQHSFGTLDWCLYPFSCIWSDEKFSCDLAINVWRAKLRFGRIFALLWQELRG